MKRIITIALLSILVISGQTTKAANNPEAALQSIEISPMASGIVNTTFLSLSKNSCTVTYSFFNSTSGSVTAKLERESGSSWIQVDSVYSPFSYTKLKSATISVSNLQAGNYRVNTDIYAIVAGTEYRESIVTGVTSIK